MPTTRMGKPRPVADADTTATTAVIAGLRDRLARAGTLNHPAVRCELRKLDELLISQLDQAGHAPGRHRSPVGATSVVTLPARTR